MKRIIKRIIEQKRSLFCGIILSGLALTTNSAVAVPEGSYEGHPALTDTPFHEAPEAVFKNAQGEEVKISDLKGKVVFINFWATWCPPCRMEMPTINKLYKQFKDDDDIVFLIVDADNKMEKSSEFAADKDYLFPVYVPLGNIPYEYFSGSLPTTVMINKKGEIVFRHAGAADYSDPKMVNFVKELIEEEG